MKTITGYIFVIVPPALAALAAALLFVQPARAQTEEPRIVVNPALLKLTPKAAASAPLTAQPQAGKEASFDLNVVYTKGRIWNPAVGRYDAVNLRSYQGASIDPDAPFVSPMLEINPGDTIRINLNNKLPADDKCAGWGGHANTPHCFNGTNLHTHGLWVNPSGNSDNVLISVNPGVSFQYEINVPSDHSAGTFWYHTHRHGSTALQVSSGMAGALIIRGNRLPTLAESGDIDTLLKPTKKQPFKERVLVFQQIQYACRDGEGHIKYIDKKEERGYLCDENDVGGVEGYDQFGPGSWPASGRYTSINGHVLPTFDDARAGQIERWRVIHGGVRDTINLQFRKRKSGASGPLKRKATEHDAYIDENCTGDVLPQHAIAADGLTTAAVIKTDQTVFQPGYRWDILMVFPDDGDYCVIDAAAPASASVNQAAPSRQLLGLVTVAKGQPVTSNLAAFLKTELIAAATANMPSPVRKKVVSDLRNGLQLSSFVWHPDIQETELTGEQELVFNIDVSTDPPVYQVNGRAFDPNRIDRTLMLGGVDEWTLRSGFVGHPFHIHVNPFQIVKILDPCGKDVSGPDAVDDYEQRKECLDDLNKPTIGDPDTQYRGLKGVWKDTLWVKNAMTPDATKGQYTLVVRTRYERYIGDYVLHCHILDHEDQGMMQIIRVALPDGKGGINQGHEH